MQSDLSDNTQVKPIDSKQLYLFISICFKRNIWNSKK